MNAMLTITEASRLLGVTERHARRMCVRGKLAGASFVTGAWLIPTTAHAKFHPAAAPDSFDSADIPEAKREEALRRLAIVTDAVRFADTATDIDRVDAVRFFALMQHIAWQTLYRWIAAWKKDGLSGLVDRRGKSDDGEFAMTQAAWDFFCSLYLDPRRPSAKTCYINTQFYSQRHDLNWRLPTLRTIQNYIDTRISEPVRILHREGQAAYDAKCAPHIIIDQTSVEPGDVWVGDHHQFDCWIWHRGEWIRPWITAWEDYRSRKIVGRHISVAPNSTTILLAMRRGVDEFGPPQSVKIDNGKDYDSQLFTGQTKPQRQAQASRSRKGSLSGDECQTLTGLYAMMNIGVSFAIPYHPQSKKIERWFDTLDCQFTKTVQTYCGKDTARRPEALAEYLKTDKAKAEAFTLETFTAAVDQYITIYNSSPHTGDGMNGLSPDVVFNQRTSRRMIDAQLLDMLMRVWSSPLTVGKNGVKFKGFWYGQYSQVLHQHFGCKVRVAYNPDDIRTVSVHDAATYKLITIAEQATLMPYGQINEEAMREATANKSRCVRLVRQARPAARVAAMSLTDLTLSAMAENTIAPSASEPISTANIKPVRTPLDGQAKEYLRQRNRQACRKAAGAESMTRLPELDMDLAVPGRTDYEPMEMDLLDDVKPRNNVRLFNNGIDL
jgi:hypothetical protein